MAKPVNLYKYTVEVDTDQMTKNDKTSIERSLKHQDTENLETLGALESVLKLKRGYVFRLPEKNQAVVMQLSGGIDSVTTVSLLIEKYRLHIYPIFIDRGQSRVKQEEGSVDFFNQYYLKRYPKYYHPVFKIKTKVPPLEIRKVIISKASEKISKKSEQRWGIPMYASLLTEYSAQYAYFLQHTKKIKIRTIFCAAVPSDSEQMAHHSLTGMRSIMLNMCCQTNDYSWQFTSPWVEKELLNYIGKDDLIRWADEKNIPIEKTWSCYFKGSAHCGRCVGCYSRQIFFKKAEVKDKTQYKYYWKEELKLKINYKLKKLKKLLPI